MNDDGHEHPGTVMITTMTRTAPAMAITAEGLARATASIDD